MDQKYRQFPSKIGIFYRQFSKQKKAPIWECFFAFTMCRENTYISRLLAILFIHKIALIIFLNYFIIKLIKIAHFYTCNSIQKMLSPKILASKNLWSQHFLHHIRMINMDYFFLLIENLLIKIID